MQQPSSFRLFPRRIGSLHQVTDPNREGPSFCTPAIQCTVITICLHGGSDMNTVAILLPSAKHNIKIQIYNSSNPPWTQMDY